MKLLDGPRKEPSKAVTSLVVLIHGYGANGADLIGLADALAPWLPGAAFVAPDAPEPLPDFGFGGRQWFPLTFRDPGELWRGVSLAGPVLDRFLDSELERYRLPPNRLALVGFSQGTMMALHVGLRRRTAPAAIVGYSGMLVGPSGAPPETMREEIRARPPVLLVHGDADEVIPVEALFFSAQALSSLEVPAQWHLSHGIGHGIDGEGLRHGGLFLARAFGLPYPA